MLTDELLIVEVGRLAKINQRLPILLLLGHLPRPSKTREVLDKGVEIGFRAIKNWNITDILKQASHASQVAQLSEGWLLLSPGIEALGKAGIELDAPMIAEVRHGLNDHIADVSDSDRRRFLDEVAAALDSKAYRAAIIMAWVGAAHILQAYVENKHLAAFNSAGISRFPKDFRAVRNLGDFGRIKEADFLQLCEDAGILGKAEKQELFERLGLRNRCGHPNSLKFAEHTAAHVEVLISAVYSKF